MQIFLILPTFNIPYSSYNYGLGYISAFLKRNGHQVNYIILRYKQDVSALYRMVKEKNPGLIGFSTTSSQFNPLKEIITELKSFSNPFIVCGGVHVTLKPECITETPGLDAIVRGEGEFALSELANALADKKTFLNIKNFWFRDPHNKKNIIKNELRPPIKDLNELPLPDKNCLDYQSVINSCNNTNYFIFSRGCPYDCPYCSNKALRDLYKGSGQYFRLMSPKRSIELIESDASRFKFDKIIFADDIICINKEWFFDFFTLYKKNFTYPFLCNVKADCIDEDMIRLLKDAGATGVAIGIEHGNEEFRKSFLKRSETNKRIIDVVECLKKNGMNDNYGHILIGLPFENEELFLDTVSLSRRLGLNYFASIFDPYPGTELGRLCEKEDWKAQKDIYNERREAVIDYPGFSRQKIQTCYDSFNFLARHKNLPLKIPFLKTIYLLKFYASLNHSKFIISIYKFIVKAVSSLKNFLHKNKSISQAN